MKNFLLRISSLFDDKWEVYSAESDKDVSSHKTYKAACRDAEKRNWEFFVAGNYKEDWMAFRVRRM